ncbi:MAG: signal peptidase I [Bacteroidetes bacterium]|nr:signal peptidase I [Bacteroidota bacterium]
MSKSSDKKQRRKQRAERESKRAERNRSTTDVAKDAVSQHSVKSSSKKKDTSSKKKKGPIREWVDAITFAVIFMVILRTVFFDLFRIPTPSMEKSLLVGDYIMVSKLHYGMRSPITLGIPFTQIYLRGIELPWTRLPGFSSPKRFDMVVFNWPADNGKPIDRKTHYIKRIIGMPGDTLSIKDKVVHVNSDTLFFKDTESPLKDTMQHLWFVYKEDPRVKLPLTRLEELGVSGSYPTTNPAIEQLMATTAAADSIASWEYVTTVRPVIRGPSINQGFSLYPGNTENSTDNFAPLLIPAKGHTIDLTPDNWLAYKPVITEFENQTASLDGEIIRINGQIADRYTFNQDYYFVMGDNRDNSEDSRFWGFVPMDHVVGRAVAVYFSWNKDGKPFLLGQIRANRMFRPIE